MAQLSPAARARSDAYFEGGYWLILWDCPIGLAGAWLFLGTRFSARLRDRIERITRFEWLQTAIYAALYILITSLLLLPWNVYENYLREHKDGLSNQTMGQWLVDQAKGLGIALGLGTLALVAIYAVLRKSTPSRAVLGPLHADALGIFALA